MQWLLYLQDCGCKKIWEPSSLVGYTISKTNNRNNPLIFAVYSYSSTVYLVCACLIVTVYLMLGTPWCEQEEQSHGEHPQQQPFWKSPSYAPEVCLWADRSLVLRPRARGRGTRLGWPLMDRKCIQLTQQIGPFRSSRPWNWVCPVHLVSSRLNLKRWNRFSTEFKWALQFHTSLATNWTDIYTSHRLQFDWSRHCEALSPVWLNLCPFS